MRTPITRITKTAAIMTATISTKTTIITIIADTMIRGTIKVATETTDATGEALRKTRRLSAISP